MAKITVIKDVDGDWEAVYLDNDVIAQTHSVNYSYEVFPALVGLTIDSYAIFETDALEELGGWAPDHLDEFEDGQLTLA